MNTKHKIIRTWKGWTTLANAPVYEDMLINEVFPAVKEKGVAGLEKVSISTMEKENERECFLVLQFDSLDDDVHQALRGARLGRIRRQALAHLNEFNVSTTLVVTVKKGLVLVVVGSELLVLLSLLLLWL